MFLALYVFAAANYGLTRESGISAFIWGATGIFTLWVLGHLLKRQLPSTGRWPWVTVAGVLAYGWGVTVLAGLNEAAVEGRIEGWDEGFPAALLLYGSAYDFALSKAAMLRTSALLGMMLLAVDLWRRPGWSRALLFTMAASVFAMVIFFFLQRIVGGSFLLSSEDQRTILSFATYRYWGNAASYLNLLWPMVAAITLFSTLRKTSAWSLWLIPCALVFAANFLNQSKAGNVLALVGAVIFAGLSLPLCVQEFRRSGQRLRKSYLLGALIPILVVMLCLPFALPWQRWDYFAKNADPVTGEGRWKAYATFLKILPDSGWVGFGPGAFKEYYQSYVDENSPLSRQSYWVAHQDYIQTAVEWGYAGTILWTLCLLPPGLLLLRAARRKPDRASHAFEGYRIGPLDHVKAFLKALPDSREPAVAIGAITAVILTALHALVDFPMQIASLQLYLLTLLALGWASRPPRRQRDEPAV